MSGTVRVRVEILARVKKPRRVWIYVNDADGDRIDELQKKYPYLSEAAAVSSLLSAALAACERDNYTHLPTEFAITAAIAKEPARFELNDTTKSKRTK